MPTASAPSRTPAHARGSCSASQASLVAVKYGSSRSPVSSATRSSAPSSRSRSQIPVVRRSCQTIARRGAAQGRAVPEDGGLALVGDADAGGLALGAGQRLAAGARPPSRSPPARAPPSPAGGSAAGTPGSRGPGRAVLGDDQRGHPGGAGVDGENGHGRDPRAAYRGPRAALLLRHRIHRGRTTIDLVSIGVVDETGREFYAVSTEFDPRQAIPWVRRNVLDQLPAAGRHGLARRERIRDDLLAFLTGPGEEIELWAWFAAYDHVALCQLWGAMPALPRPIPRFTRDLRQRWDDLGQPPLPPKPAGTARRPRRRPLQPGPLEGHGRRRLSEPGERAADHPDRFRRRSPVGHGADGRRGGVAGRARTDRAVGGPAR